MPQTEGPLRAWFQDAYKTGTNQEIAERLSILEKKHNKLVKVLKTDLVALLITLIDEKEDK